MLVARNLAHVTTMKRTSRLRVAFGLLLFIAGAPLSFLSFQFLIVAYTLVILGFVVFNGGLQGVAKWGRKVRNDRMLDNELRRLSDRYTLIHFATLGKRTPEHILVHETGIVVITPKDVIGTVDVKGTRYSKVGAGIFGRFLGASGPQLGNPGVENGLDRKAVLDALAAEAPAHGWPTDFPIDGLVVFTAPRVVARVADDADPPAVKMAEVFGWVQQHTRGLDIVLPTEARQEIVDFLIAKGGAVMEGHIEVRGTLAEEVKSAKSTKPARNRPATPDAVVKERSDRERLARRPAATTTATNATDTAASATATATTTGAKGRRRGAEPAVVTTADARPLSPRVPAAGMAKVKRRERAR